MSRSVWKGNYIAPFFFRVSSKKVLLKKKIIKVWNRASSIPFSFINKNVLIYNGKVFKKIFITRQKVGYKFGELCFTRMPRRLMEKKKKSKNTIKKA